MLIEKEYNNGKHNGLTEDQMQLLSLLQDWEGIRMDKEHPLPNAFKIRRVVEELYIEVAVRYSSNVERAKALGVSYYTVRDRLKELEKANVITKTGARTYRRT